MARFKRRGKLFRRGKKRASFKKRIRKYRVSRGGIRM